MTRIFSQDGLHTFDVVERREIHDVNDAVVANNDGGRNEDQPTRTMTMIEANTTKSKSIADQFEPEPKISEESKKIDISSITLFHLCCKKKQCSKENNKIKKNKQNQHSSEIYKEANGVRSNSETEENK